MASRIGLVVIEHSPDTRPVPQWNATIDQLNAWAEEHGVGIPPLPANCVLDVTPPITPEQLLKFRETEEVDGYHRGIFRRNGINFWESIPRFNEYRSMTLDEDTLRLPSTASVRALMGSYMEIAKLGAPEAYGQWVVEHLPIPGAMEVFRPWLERIQRETGILPADVMTAWYYKECRTKKDPELTPEFLRALVLLVAGEDYFGSHPPSQTNKVFSVLSVPPAVIPRLSSARGLSEASDKLWIPKFDYDGYSADYYNTYLAQIRTWIRTYDRKIKDIQPVTVFTL